MNPFFPVEHKVGRDVHAWERGTPAEESTMRRSRKGLMAAVMATPRGGSSPNRYAGQALVVRVAVGVLRSGLDYSVPAAGVPYRAWFASKNPRARPPLLR